METKPRFTPGPWHINGYYYVRDNSAPTGRAVHLCAPDSDLCEGYTINSSNHQICEIKSHRGGHDARLIAAAPELLSALEFVLADLNTELDYEARIIIGRVIAKAKGE